jgi:hypothetical protein
MSDVEMRKVTNEEASTEKNVDQYNVGVVNNPCGAPVCAKTSIDPEEFLSECFAPVCWDCWFVSQKIQL